MEGALTWRIQCQGMSPASCMHGSSRMVRPLAVKVCISDLVAEPVNQIPVWAPLNPPSTRKPVLSNGPRSLLAQFSQPSAGCKSRIMNRSLGPQYLQSLRARLTPPTPLKRPIQKQKMSHRRRPLLVPLIFSQPGCKSRITANLPRQHIQRLFG